MSRQERWLYVAVLVAVIFVAAARAKATNSKKTRKAKTPKLNLKTLSAKMATLEGKLSDIETKVNKIDNSIGKLEDDPPCPLKHTQGFFMSTEIQSCYQITQSTSMMNWTAAQNHCTDLHSKAHLVAIESVEEQQYLKAKWYNELGISSVSRFWTDASKRGRDLDMWYWVTADSPLELGYTNWIPTTTHDDERFNCMAVYANEGFFWGDVACWAPHVVTCEIEL